VVSKFMAVMTKRDETLISQLNQLNSNLNTQNTQMCQMFLKVMKKQESIINNIKFKSLNHIDYEKEKS
jgi:hypothetical protein